MMEQAEGGRMWMSDRRSREGSDEEKGREGMQLMVKLIGRKWQGSRGEWSRRRILLLGKPRDNRLHGAV